MNATKNRFIYFDSTEIITNGILWGMVELELDVSRSDIKVTIDKKIPDEITCIEKELHDFDIAITQDFSVNVAEACHSKGKLYISWIYDSPQSALYSSSALYDENYVFAFDREQVKRLRSIGLKHVFHQPLAANVLYSSSISITDEDISKYNCDVSFIGQMYIADYFNGLLNKLPDSVFQKYISTCDRIACKWSPQITIFNSFDEEMVNEFSKHIQWENFKDLSMSPGFLAECLFLGPILAQIERKKIFELSSENSSFSLYTRDSDFEIAKKNLKGNIFPSVHGEDVYKIYYSSKLNLNITLRRIETGIPQRIFDIMGVGAPVITNYQEEIDDLFEPGKDIIVFKSSDEYVDKLRYYLKHDKERQRIGINGYYKVRDKYNYSNSLMNMFSKI